MKVEAKDIFSDVDFMKQHVASFQFGCRNGAVVENKMPTINVYAGWVIVHPTDAYYMDELVNRLSKYDFAVKQTDKNKLLVECASNSDFICMAGEVLRQRLMERKADNMDTLHNEIDMLAKQVPYVKSSVFSRGVKNFRHSVDILNTVVQTQKKYLGR